MRLAAIDRMSPSMPDFTAPVVQILQQPSRRSVGALLALLIVIGALMLFPFYLLASTALADGGLRDAVADRPLAALQVLTGLAFWLLLIGFPVYRLGDALTRARTIAIADGVVTVEDRAFGQCASWSAPLGEFIGVAPYLRASLSGVRHELVLVHPDRSRSVLIALADRLQQSEVDRIARVLGRPELSPSAVRGALGLARSSATGATFDAKGTAVTAAA
jgi:hypothetical protein